VKCRKCGMTFNGKTRKSNTRAILIYIGAGVLMLAVLILLLVLMSALA
jgi:hypothetical protein